MRSGGKLTVGVRTEQSLQNIDSKDLWLVLEIADTGSGIEPADLPHVFEPYFSRSEDGTGIGLVIVKKIVEDHGGTISISSELHVGTTVTVRLPTATQLDFHEQQS